MAFHVAPACALEVGPSCAAPGAASSLRQSTSTADNECMCPLKCLLRKGMKGKGGPLLTSDTLPQRAHHLDTHTHTHIHTHTQQETDSCMCVGALH